MKYFNLRPFEEFLAWQLWESLLLFLKSFVVIRQNVCNLLISRHHLLSYRRVSNLHNGIEIASQSLNKTYSYGVQQVRQHFVLVQIYYLLLYHSVIIMKMFFLVNNDLVSRSQYINHLEHKALFLPKIYCFILVKLKIELGVSFNIQISTIIVTHFHYTLEVLAHVYQQFVNQKFKHFILLNPNVFDFIVRFWFQLDNILLTILGYTPLSVLIVPLRFLNFQYFYPINSMLKYFLIFLSCSILNTSLLLVFLYNLGQAHLQQLSDLLQYQSISLFFWLIPIASQSFIKLKCKWGFQQSHQFFFQ